MLSLPFQQTAYFLFTTDEAVPERELKAIEAVLGDAQTIKENYDKDIADPVKALYKDESGTSALVRYMAAWAKGGLRHPFIYTRAFLLHTYGWYSPVLSNEIRYETEYDGIKSSMLFPKADSAMVFLYRFAARFTPLGLLENVGFFVWGLFFLTVLLLKGRKKEALITLPLWISLLICLASPCFLGHPRYALVILAGLPFCILFSKTGRS